MPRPFLVRYAGLAGTLLLAVAAWLGGATSPWEPTVTPSTIFAGRDGVLLPLAWLLGTALLIGAWWAGRRSVPSTRWAYVTAGLWALPLLPFLPLGSYDVYSYACQGWQQAAGSDPYAGGVDLLGCPWADAVAPTWRASPAPYGPVFLVLAAAAAKLGGSLTGAVALLRLIAVLGVAVIGWCLPVLARRAGVPPERAVWLVLACPLVPIHLISGAHNEAVMIALILAGLTVAAAGHGVRRMLLAGVLLGLAVGVKATAVVVLPFAVLLFAGAYSAASGSAASASAASGSAASASAASGSAASASAASGSAASASAASGSAVSASAAGPGGGLRSGLFWKAAAVLGGGAAAALAAVSFGSGLGLGWVTGLTGSGVSVQWTAPPTAIGLTLELIGVPNAVPVTRVLGMIALVVVLVVLWLRARNRDPVHYAGLALAATVLLAPVFHPWYALWPLAVLAATVRRETMWLVAPCAAASALCLPDGYNLALVTKAQGAVVMTVLAGYLAWKVLHEANRDSRRLGAAHGGDRVPRRDA